MYPKCPLYIDTRLISVIRTHTAFFYQLGKHIRVSMSIVFSCVIVVEGGGEEVEQCFEQVAGNFLVVTPGMNTVKGTGVRDTDCMQFCLEDDHCRSINYHTIDMMYVLYQIINTNPDNFLVHPTIPHPSICPTHPSHHPSHPLFQTPSHPHSTPPVPYFPIEVHLT